MQVFWNISAGVWKNNTIPRLQAVAIYNLVWTHYYPPLGGSSVHDARTCLLVTSTDMGTYLPCFACGTCIHLPAMAVPCMSVVVENFMCGIYGMSFCICIVALWTSCVDSSLFWRMTFCSSPSCCEHSLAFHLLPPRNSFVYSPYHAICFVVFMACVCFLYISGRQTCCGFC